MQESLLPLVLAPTLAPGQVWFDQPISNCVFINNTGVALSIQRMRGRVAAGMIKNVTLGSYPQWADASVYGLGTMRITNCSFQGGNTSCMESIKFNMLNRHPLLSIGTIIIFLFQCLWEVPCGQWW